MNPKQIIGTALGDIFQESDGLGGDVSKIYLIGALHYLSLSERERDEMEMTSPTVPPMEEVRSFWESKDKDIEGVIPVHTERGRP